MAQDINVPVVTPNPVQFQSPTDLINGYLNRKQQNVQDTLNRVTDLGQTLNSYKQQRIQNQLAALQAYTGIAKAVGPDAANQVAGGIPNMPSFQPQSAPAANPGQTAPAASSQGSPQTIGGNSQPSPFIQASLQAGHPDYSGQLQRIQGQMAGYQNKGDWGREQQQQLAAQIPAVTAQMDADKQPYELAEIQGKLAMQPTEMALKGQQLTNAKAEIPMKIGEGSAHQADEAATANTSVMSALDALKNLDDAYQRIPADQKGPGMGTLIAKAGNLASKKYPEAVAYNKLREGSIGPIAAGLDPKGRQGPSLLDQLGKTVPGIDTDPTVYRPLMSSIHKQLASQGQRNYESYNSAAGSFGGSITKPNIPPNKFDFQYTATNPKTNHQIGSNDQKTWIDLTTGKPVQ